MCNVILRADEERIGAKRKKKVQHFGNFFGDGGGTGFGGAAGVGGANVGNFFSKSRSYSLDGSRMLLLDSRP